MIFRSNHRTAHSKGKQCSILSGSGTTPQAISGSDFVREEQQDAKPYSRALRQNLCLLVKSLPRSFLRCIFKNQRRCFFSKQAHISIDL